MHQLIVVQRERKRISIDSTSENEVLMIVGDFNARVGSRNKGNSEWMGVLGCHGIGKVNDQGMAFLQFCMINSLTIMNTWFEKRPYQKQTWQHPGTKVWHCSDYVLMRQNQRKLCNDTQVMRGANCWTDHKLIRSKIQPGRVRYAVEKLSDLKVKESFQEKVRLWLYVKWKDAQDKWSVMRDGIIDSAEVVLGKSKKYKSDWFRESGVKLDPLIEEKQRSFRKLLNNRCLENIMKFKRARSSVQREIRKAKNDWFMDKAKQIEELESSGMGGAVWKVIRQMQQRRAGRLPVRSSVVKKLNGELFQGVEELSERWREHFIKVLNVETDFDEATVRELDATNIREDLDRPPEYEEIKKAISRLKRGKAGGESGILPELVLNGGQALHSKLKDLMFLVWESERVHSDWCNAVIVPILKREIYWSVITGEELVC